MPNLGGESAHDVIGVSEGVDVFNDSQEGVMRVPTA